MGGRMAICIGEGASRNPAIVGLEGEMLADQDWLDVYTTGSSARRGVSENGSLDEFWVVSCDDVDPINLAAAVKGDVPKLPVRLVTEEACGSLFSRAHIANIDEVVESRAFPRRYEEMKRLRTAASSDAGVAPGEGASGERGQDTLHECLSGSLPAVADPPSVSERLPSMQLIERLPETNAQPLPMALASDSRAFVLTVVSGSGGVGKSAASTLAALVSQSAGNRTLLLDCDLQFGDVASMVGVESPLCIDEALAHPERIEAELSGSGSLAVLAAPSRLEASEEIVSQLPGLLGHLSTMFDVIVVNTGSSWSEQHAVLLERSSVALFLVDQRVSSVHSCRHALELCSRCGIASGPFRFALNRCAKGAPLTSIDVSSALQGAPVFELKDGGNDVEDFLSSGAASELIEMRNEFAESIEQVMAKLLPNGEALPASQASRGESGFQSGRRGLRFSKRRGRKQL